MAKMFSSPEEKKMLYSENWGGKRKNSGRKELYPGGRQQLAISCSLAQKEAIQQAAKNDGLTTAEYVLMKCGVLNI